MPPTINSGTSSRASDEIADRSIDIDIKATRIGEYG
jgi:hypothetical protein